MRVRISPGALVKRKREKEIASAIRAFAATIGLLPSSPIGELGSRVGYSVKDLKTNKTFFVSVNLVPKDSFTIPR